MSHSSPTPEKFFSYWSEVQVLGVFKALWVTLICSQGGQPWCLSKQCQPGREASWSTLRDSDPEPESARKHHLRCGSSGGAPA
jgi:hypothetical protein